MVRLAAILLPMAVALAALRPASAQPLDLSRGGPIEVTATDGLEWRQNEQEVIARGNARAVRQNVTVTADRLIAHYRKKSSPPGATDTKAATPANASASAPSPASPPDADADTAGSEVYRVEAEGHVHIFTPTDHAEGDQAIYDMDQAVLVMTGNNLRLTTPQDVLTARDSMEYWAQKHMAVARGNAVVVTNDGRRLAADTLVAYTTDTPQPPDTAPRPVNASTKPDAKTPDDQLAASGKLQKVDAIGNVSVRTATDTVTGDRAVYVPDTGIARVAGHVRITRGQNQLNGAQAEVNLRTGVSRLLSGPAGRVQGLVVPNDTTNQTGDGIAQGKAAPSKGTAP